MKDFDILWRFVFEADEQATAQKAADEVARLVGLTDLPPVKSYKEVNWWKTDIVVHASDESLAVLLGRQLALAAGSPTNGRWRRSRSLMRTGRVLQFSMRGSGTRRRWWG